ncbi:MAG: hypothetical protein ABI123_08100 [Ginsengibacter sp.]
MRYHTVKLQPYLFARQQKNEIVSSYTNSNSLEINKVNCSQLYWNGKQKLTPQECKSRRWRILFIRALINRELLVTNGRMEGETLKKPSMN